MSRNRTPSFPPEKMATPTGGECWRCTARRRGTSDRCKLPAVKDSRSMKCKLHGGRPLQGSENPAWRGGVSQSRYDALMEPLLNERYAKALQDPQLLEQHDEIALLIGKIQDELSKLEAAAAWPEAAASFERLKVALHSGDRAEIHAALTGHDALVRGQADRERGWSRVMRLIDRKRKLTESQRKRLQELHVMVHRDEVLRFANALLEACTRHVQDTDTLRAIQRDFAAVVGTADTIH